MLDPCPPGYPQWHSTVHGLMVSNTFDLPASGPVYSPVSPTRETVATPHFWLDNPGPWNEVPWRTVHHDTLWSDDGLVTWTAWGRPEVEVTWAGPLDVNLDGFVTGADFDQFMQWFEWGCQAADFNGDGFMNGEDFDTFLEEWTR